MLIWVGMIGTALWGADCFTRCTYPAYPGSRQNESRSLHICCLEAGLCGLDCFSRS